MSVGFYVYDLVMLFLAAGLKKLVKFYLQRHFLNKLCLPVPNVVNSSIGISQSFGGLS